MTAETASPSRRSFSPSRVACAATACSSTVRSVTRLEKLRVTAQPLRRAGTISSGRQAGAAAQFVDDALAYHRQRGPRRSGIEVAPIRQRVDAHGGEPRQRGAPDAPLLPPKPRPSRRRAPPRPSGRTRFRVRGRSWFGDDLGDVVGELGEGLRRPDTDADRRDVQPSIAEPPALLRQFAQPRPHLAIIRRARPIPHTRAVRPDGSTCPTSPGGERPLVASRQASPLFDSRSFNAAWSSIVSASRRLGRAFSSSRDRSRFASAKPRPPNFAYPA